MHCRKSDRIETTNDILHHGRGRFQHTAFISDIFDGNEHVVGNGNEINSEY
jgi:hypothetical protein